MSTYTDLQTKIKENIVVDYRNRATPQEVHLLNANNEYWGKFKGSIDAASCLINTGTLSNVNITNSVISGNTVLLDEFGNSINLATFQNEFQNIQDDVSSALDEVEKLKEIVDNNLGVDTTELSIKIDELDKKIISSNIITTKNINYLSNEIDSEISNRISSINNVTSIIDSKISTLNKIDIILSTNLSTEILERKSDITKLTDIISGEIINRAIGDQRLGNAISTVNDTLTHKLEHEIQDRISADNELKNYFSENISSSVETLSVEFQKNLNNQKHYSIKRFPASLYIFNVEDYKTNIIETVVDGYSVYCDNVLVGKLYNLDNDDFAKVTTATLDVYQNVSSPINILHDTYNLKINEPVYCDTEGFKTYTFTLKYVDGKLTIEVNGKLSKYNIVLDNGIDSGEYYFEIDGDESKVLYIDNLLLKFKNFVSEYDFKTNDRIIATKENITTIAELNLEDRKINLSDDCVISSILPVVDSKDIRIGNIYKQNLIGEISSLEKIIISDIKYNYGDGNIINLPSLIELTKENNFKSYEGLIPHYYATYNISDDTFEVHNEKNVYKYSVLDVNTESLINKNISVLIDLDNHTISSQIINPTTDSISVILNATHPELSVANGIYEFNAKNGWFITTKDEQQLDLRIWVDFIVDPISYVLTIKLHNKTTGTAVLYYQILAESAEISPEYSYYLVNVKSKEIGIKTNKPFETYEFAKNTYELTIDDVEYSRGQLRERYTLETNEYIQSEIKIDLPVYNESKEYLSEGLIHICPYSHAKNTEAILLFNNNDLIVYNGKYVNQINIPVNITTQLRFNEVFKGSEEQSTTFVIANDSDYMLYKDITSLSSILSTESNKIIQISNDISIINTNISSINDNITTIENNINILSTELSVTQINISSDISALTININDKISNVNENIENLSSLTLSSNEIITENIELLSSAIDINSNNINTLSIDTENALSVLSIDINNTISDLSAELVSSDNIIKTSIDNLSVFANNISTDVEKLSSENYNKITDISIIHDNTLSTTNKLISNISVELSALNVSYTKTLLSTGYDEVEAGLNKVYNKYDPLTDLFKSTNLLKIKIPDELLIRDSATGDIYKLMVENGSLKLQTYLSVCNN